MRSPPRRSVPLFDNLADPYQLKNLASIEGHEATLGRFRDMLRASMARLNDTFESCTWYRDHWTDGQRNIIRSATCEFAGVDSG
jgi:hypothetical protein